MKQLTGGSTLQMMNNAVRVKLAGGSLFNFMKPRRSSATTHFKSNVPTKTGDSDGGKLGWFNQRLSTQLSTRKKT